MTAIETLEVIDASQEGEEAKSYWEEEAERALGSRHNFVIVFSPGNDGLSRLAELLDCPPTTLPEKLFKWGIHGLNEALPAEDYQWLLSVCSAHDVRFIEQLHLTCNRPPSLKPYIVYCELRGVLSDHDELEEARIALWKYIDDLRPARTFPQAGIYRWENHEWTPVHNM